MRVTLEVSQFEMSSLNVEQPLKAFDKSVTCAMFHPLM
jgi:hypothetical protein